MIKYDKKQVLPVTRRGAVELSRCTDIESGESSWLMTGHGKELSPNLRTVLGREYKISSDIDSEKILSGQKLLDTPTGPALMLENFDGMPLEFYSALFHDEFEFILRAASYAARALQVIHNDGIVHRGIDARSILLSVTNAETIEGAALTFMGLSMKSDKGKNSGALGMDDSLDFFSPEYISPEITGMVDLETDHRADLYSLGIVLYEMLTGSLPFRSGNRREVLNWHVARKPVPPREVNGAVPQVLSDMVMLLLSKEPKERYESAEALILDIDNCLKNLSEDDTIKKFPLMPMKALSGINFSKEIAGRKNEKELLLQHLDCAEERGCAVSFVSGHAGIGKTALVKFLEKEVMACGGWFASGKFDQNRIDIPYAVFSEAVGSLVKQVLMSNENDLIAWKNNISSALKPNGLLLTGISPDLEYLIEMNEIVLEGNPESRVTLFRQTFKKFIAVIASRKTPLVIFLDDLQWADSASLDLLKFLVEGSPVDGLMVIGAFRDNEIDEKHPLNPVLKKIGSTGYPSQLIFLETLDAAAVEKILADALRPNINRRANLASLIIRKTGGNPFYVRKFILSLHESGLLYAGEGGQWKWDLHKIEDIPATENVVDLLIYVIDHLSVDEKEVLKVASCMRDCFTRDLLYIVSGMNEKRLGGILKQLRDKDLLTADVNLHYSFSHDRVKEAAAGLLSEAESKKFHHKIGIALLQLFGDENLEEYIFEITDHLNACRDLMTDEDELNRLLHLNLQAAVKAVNITAYSGSVRYYRHVIETASETLRKDDDQFLYEIYRSYAHTLYLANEYEEATAAVEDAMKYCFSEYQQIELFEILINIKTITLETEEAMNLGLQTLKRLGLDLFKDRDNPEKSVEEMLVKVRKYFDDPDFGFSTMSLCVDEKVICILKIIEPVTIACFQLGDMQFSILLNLYIVLLSLKYGISSTSVVGFSVYSYFAGPLWGEYDRAKMISKAALELCKKFNYNYQLCLVAVQYAVFVNYWHEHLKHADELLELAEQKGWESGNYIFLNYCTSHQVVNSFALGRNIESCMTLIDDKLRLVESINHEEMIACLVSYKHAYLNLQGKTESLTDFSFNENTEESFLQDCRDKELHMAFVLFITNKVLVEYIYGMFDASLSEIESIDLYSTLFITHFHYVDFYFLRSLSITSDFERFSSEESEERMAWVKEFQIELKGLAEQTPDNLMFKYLLIEAEIARIEERIPEAMTLYDQAISEAYRNEYRQFEAIACERTAEFWRGQGKDEFGFIYLDRAYICYKEWGAVRKVELIESAYSERYKNSRIESGFSEEEILNLLHSFNSLSSHLDAGGLVNELGDIALSHSGAESFMLFIEQDSGNRIMVKKIKDDESESSIEMLPVEIDDTETEMHFPLELMRYVKRTGKDIFLYDDDMHAVFKNTRYIQVKKPKSAFCLRRSTPRGDVVWYLENSIMKGAFAQLNLKVFEMLTMQALLCIENVLYREGMQMYSPAEGLAVKNEGETKIIAHEKIIYCSSHGRRTVVHTSEEEYEINSLLKEIEKNFPPSLFSCS